MTVELVVLDVDESLSDLSPPRKRFTGSGAPVHLLETWFAATLRDGFALAVAGRSQPFPAVGAAVLRGLLNGLDLSRPLDEAVSTCSTGSPSSTCTRTCRPVCAHSPTAAYAS